MFVVNKVSGLVVDDHDRIYLTHSDLAVSKKFLIIVRIAVKRVLAHGDNVAAASLWLFLEPVEFIQYSCRDIHTGQR